MTITTFTIVQGHGGAKRTFIYNVLLGLPGRLPVTAGKSSVAFRLTMLYFDIWNVLENLENGQYDNILNNEPP